MDNHANDCAMRVHSANECTCGKATYDAFATAFGESFMQPVIEHGDYFEVETSHGTEFVPADVVHLPFRVIHAAGGFYDEDSPEWPAIVQAFGPYVAGDMQSVSPGHGWLARMSAPGYMDCTEWRAYKTEIEAMQALIDMYGNED